MTTYQTKWKRERAGLYSAVIGGERYEVERFGPEDTGESGVIWQCRVDGVPFDAAETLREAKLWCLTP